MTDKHDDAAPPPNGERKPPSQDQIVETTHHFMIDGQEIAYTVTTGTLILKEETEKKGDKEGESEGEKPKAAFFFIASIVLYTEFPSRTVEPPIMTALLP